MRHNLPATIDEPPDAAARPADVAATVVVVPAVLPLPTVDEAAIVVAVPPTAAVLAVMLPQV